MSVAPDIQLEPVQIGGVRSPVRVYYRPRCLRCRWQTEPAPNRDEATQAGADHLTLGCLAEVGEES